MKALVFDAHLKGSLAIIRSLGEKGVSVSAASKRSSACGLHSRYVAERYMYHSPQNLLAFYRDVERILSEHTEAPVIYALSDATVLALARNPEIMQRINMLMPSSEKYEIAFSKKRTLEHANQLGLPIPRMIQYTDLHSLERAVSSTDFPLVVKPQHSFMWVGDRGERGDVSVVHSLSELIHMVETIHTSTQEWPLVQEYISGEECGVEFLYLNGEAYALCAHKRIRSLSPGGGASTVKETIHIPNDIGEMSERLLDSLSWHGPAMVEWKRNTDGTPFLMEINGRFWGSLPVAVAAGVNIPYMYYLAASGKKISKTVCRSGVRTQHILGDIAHILGIIGRKGYVEGRPYPKLLPTIKNFFFDLIRAKHDVWSLKDPLPGIWEIIDYSKKLMKKS